MSTTSAKEEAHVPSLPPGQALESEEKAAAVSPPAAAPDAAAAIEDRGNIPSAAEAEGEEATAPAALLIPKASIKRIMKLDPDTKQLSQDAIMLMAKATELFVDKLAKASHAMAVANKRKTIKYEDIADARLSDKSMEFLDGVVPQIP